MESSTPPFRLKTKLVFVCFGVATLVFLLYADRCEVQSLNASDAAATAKQHIPPPDNNNDTAVRTLDRFQLTGPNVATVNSKEIIDVLIVFTRAHKIRNLREKLSICLTSLFARSSAPLHLRLVTDRASQEVARQVLTDASAESSVSILVDLLDVEDVASPLEEMVSYLQPHFSNPFGYYQGALFFLSMGLHRVFHMARILLLDVDLELRSDIALLHSHFRRFPPRAVVGIAQEQQPVYRHVFHKFHKEHPETRCGEPPPEGHPGFNSGVVLLDLDRMRSSREYAELSSRAGVKYLTSKYSFRGHLGDQCFYTVAGCERPELFYVLPCTWNRQLCHWWKDHGYADVFDRYHACPGRADIYHGNCNSTIPATDGSWRKQHHSNQDMFGNVA